MFRIQARLLSTVVVVGIFLVFPSSSPVLAQEGSIDPQPEDFAAFVDDILDPNTPLPSCEDVGVEEVLGCDALCQAINGGDVDVSNTRDTNGQFVCTCENQVACSDQPTCEQLLILPGRVLEGCSNLCGDLFTAVEDEIEFAGDISAGNKDLTHFVVECRCDGNVACTDYILFSDLAEPETCDSLSIDSADSCDAYCETASGGLFDLGGNYTINEGTDQGICECQATSVNALRDTDVSQACTDIPAPEGPEACSLQNPCPTQPPGSEGDGSGTLGYSPTTMATAAVILIAGMAMGVY